MPGECLVERVPVYQRLVSMVQLERRMHGMVVVLEHRYDLRDCRHGLAQHLEAVATCGMGSHFAPRGRVHSRHHAAVGALRFGLRHRQSQLLHVCALLVLQALHSFSRLRLGVGHALGAGRDGQKRLAAGIAAYISGSAGRRFELLHACRWHPGFLHLHALVEHRWARTLPARPRLHNNEVLVDVGERILDWIEQAVMGAGVGDLDLGVLLRLLALLQQNLCRSGKHDRLLHVLGLGRTPTCNLVLRPRLRHVACDLVLSGEALRDHDRMVGAEEGRCPDSQCQAAGGTSGAGSDRVVRLRMRGTTSGSELHLKVVTSCPCTLTRPTPRRGPWECVGVAISDVLSMWPWGPCARLRFSDQGQMSEISVAARLSSKGF
mmetsp:Transcript_36396/g.103604  ORF Transcript_36396/g.103604 Transcript_36396/m.103604 type:complete len:377 (-) Transcript_36396:129-1259(-)